MDQKGLNSDNKSNTAYCVDVMNSYINWLL